jgi:hypothetical protein
LCWFCKDAKLGFDIKGERQTRVVRKRVLRRIFEPKRDEFMGVGKWQNFWQ